jgi:hypothetical protein
MALVKYKGIFISVQFGFQTAQILQCGHRIILTNRSNQSQFIVELTPKEAHEFAMAIIAAESEQ